MALPALLRDNLSIPVVGAPLFIISNPNLVIEQCKAGIVGSFPSLDGQTWICDYAPGSNSQVMAMAQCGLVATQYFSY